MKSAVPVTFDNVIYRVQSARGATMYWKHLLTELEHRADIDVVERAARSPYSRYLPLVAPSGVIHSSLFRRGVPGRGQRLVVTAHDLAYERRFIDTRRSVVGRIERAVAIRAAEGIVCVSEATRDDLLEYYGRHLEKTALIVAPHGPSVPRIAEPGVQVHDPAGRRLLLHVGHRDSYKNFDLLRSTFRAHRELGSTVAVLVVGPPPGPHETDLVAVPRAGDSWTLPTKGSLFYLGRVTDEDLSGLYQIADTTVCPSRFEGFGFPVLDALNHGCPVACSRIPSHAEIAGELARYFEPTDTESLAAALADEQPLPPGTERALRGRFNWAGSADAHVELYKQIDAR